MNLVRINDTQSINTDNIDAIEKNGELQTFVFIGSQRFLADIPFDAFMNIIKPQTQVEPQTPSTEGLLRTFLKDSGTWAG
jgi:hypothetical protein